MTLQEEIAESITQARFDSINTERDPFYYMAQAAIDVVERRLLSEADKERRDLGNGFIDHSGQMAVKRAWQQVKEG